MNALPDNDFSNSYIKNRQSGTEAKRCNHDDMINLLPRDLSSYLLRYLDYSNLKVMSLVSHHWRKLALPEITLESMAYRISWLLNNNSARNEQLDEGIKKRVFEFSGLLENIPLHKRYIPKVKDSLQANMAFYKELIKSKDALLIAEALASHISKPIPQYEGDIQESLPEVIRWCQKHAKQLGQLKILNLSSIGIHYLPEEILPYVSNILELDLSSNQLMTLPNMYALKKLEMLHLCKNRFRCFPKEICKLETLTELIVSNNQIEKISREIKNLIKLKYLHLDQNKIKIIPGYLCALKNLKELNLKGNNLSTISHRIGRMQKLQALDLENNNLKSLPDELYDIRSLESLNLASCKLPSLSSKISQLISLDTLVLNDNFIKILPPELWQLTNLRVLGLSQNKIHSISQELSKLQNLNLLNIASNPLVSRPKALLQLTNLDNLLQ